MKILFSNLPWWEVAGHTTKHHRQGIRAGSRWPFTRHAAHDPDNFRFGGYLPAPFFLQYAASYTQRELPESEVVLRDSIARGESYSSFMAWVETWRPDWIVVETATPSWEHDERLIKILATKLPDARVILCGPVDAKHAPEILLNHRNIAAVVQGEPDKQIAKAIRGTSGLVPHDLLTLPEMNAAPLPMWDEACTLNYWDGCPVGHQPPQLQIWTSRGCPFRCCFCVWPATMTGNDPDGTKPRSVRCYSPDYMERLISSRLEAAANAGRPYHSIYLDDDTFNLTEKHTVAMCGVMQKFGLPWSAMCRADTISREAWQLMKDSGCFGVKIGFESGSQEVIDRIVNKRLNLAKARETAIWLRSIGLSVHGTFTVGLPGETEAQRRETLAFIEALYRDGGLDTHQLSGTATIEGTPLAAIAAGEHLAKYPGATSEGFVVTGDGQRKIEEMRR
jgi:hypothetical protein